MAQSIGFIGLGIMGQPMALNLVKTGHKVTTFNRTRSKAEALEKAGATVVASPAEAARQADVVMIIVSDTAAMLLSKEPSLTLNEKVSAPLYCAHLPKLPKL